MSFLQPHVTTDKSKVITAELNSTMLFLLGRVVKNRHERERELVAKTLADMKRNNICINRKHLAKSSRKCSVSPCGQNSIQEANYIKSVFFGQRSFLK